MRCALAILTSWTLLSYAHSAHSAASIVDRPQAVCAYLARAANSGSLAKVLLGGHVAHDPAFPHPEALADWDVAFQDLIDINNDGKAEYVYVVQYPPRSRDDSPSIEEVLITGPFEIPRHGYGQQELFVFDQTLQQIELESAQDDTKALSNDADRYRFLRHGTTYYLVAQHGDDLSYVQRFDGTNIAQPVCAFEKDASGKRPQTRALTTYQWLNQSFKGEEGYPGILWEHAFARDDLAVAELLVKNGRSVNERIRNEILLVWAIKEKRADIVDWLLKHGADPSIDQGGYDAPLALALRHETVPLALKLIKHGADPAPLIDDIVRLEPAPPEQKRSLMLATIDSLGYVPEEFVLYALDTDTSLLDGFIASRAPVRPLGVSWHAGERMRLPFNVDRYIQGKAASSAEQIERLFRRGTVAPKGNLAVTRYGSYLQGVQVVRFDGSNVSDEDFLFLATALCYYFMSFDCGAEELVVRARAWADAQPDECPASVRSVVNDQACRVVGYYVRSGYEVHAFSVFAEAGFNGGDYAVEWKQFVATYRAKHVTPP